jgi:UDP-N-acetylglucosamine 4,6-dehydratase
MNNQLSFKVDFSILNNKVVLVTGGTGTFGKAFARKVLEEATPKKIIIFSRDELKQYEMSQEFSDHPKFQLLRFFIGDVRNLQRLETAFNGVDYVVHAAAMKHVTISEYNPLECIHTNVLGAENVVQASMRTGVKKVMALSTDKAVNPVNLYGASKLASDKIFVAANNLSGEGGTRFSLVRYGNVIGSRGSVLPLFQQLISEGASALPITDVRMTRFWITINQGIDFVVSGIEVMRGGEVFVPKIPSMRVVDLATAIAPNLPHKIVGIRAGEKLHEVMITEDHARNTIELKDRYIIEPLFPFWSRQRYFQEAQAILAEDFRYSSDSNSEWLSEETLLNYIQ